MWNARLRGMEFQVFVPIRARVGVQVDIGPVGTGDGVSRVIDAKEDL